MKYREDRPFENPEAAARKLLQIVLSGDIDVGLCLHRRHQ